MKIVTEEDILKELIKQASKANIRTEEDLHKLKKKFAKEFRISLPTNFKLQESYEKLIQSGWEGDKSIQRLMRKRKIRTLSGVSVITVLMKPYSCPGKCVFCPTEPGMPKSYLSNEPGAMRAVLDNFNPYAQVTTRLSSLSQQGHETDKIEMIVLGGTFSAYPREYQIEFIKALFDACNGVPSSSLEEAQKINEYTKHRIIGLSLETRPDHINEEEVKFLRELGCTKLQIGAQHTSNEVLKYNKRGETIEDTINALKLLKDAGFKIATHLMPNLPGSTPEMDIQMIRDFFSNPDFKPDQLKIYPCVVTPYTELEQWVKEGKFKTYSDETLIEILIEMKKIIPEYVRIERLFRDIPGESILDGSQMTNMRQILESKMKALNVKCNCIRCREIKDETYDPDSTEFRCHEYDASDGKEFFLSFNDANRDKICSLLRLRFPSKTFIRELKEAALIREVHTYGAQVKIGKDAENASQHAGLGRRLLEKAEEMAKKAGYKKMAIIAGIGTRSYYKKWGYELEGTYMTKAL